MSQEEADAERIPLLRGAFHNTNYRINSNNNRRHSTFGYLKFGFIILAILLLLINLGFYFIESDEEIEIMSKRISKIPYEYYMGLKNDNWIGFDNLEYVIESSPPNDPTFSKLFDNQDANFTEDSSHDRLKIAEIVTKSHNAWNPAYYEVREERYEPYNNYTVLTTQSYMSRLWFIIWPPKVHVSFVSFASIINDDNNDDNGGITKFIKDHDQEKILRCDYKISWNYKYLGEIYRKCPNQKKWVKIAYVKGSSEWGMQWLDPEGIETYGIVTKPAHGKNRQMRSVVVRPDSPFPPILPALYVAYFDRIINRGDSDGRTNLLVN